MPYNWDDYGQERLLSRNKLLLPHHRQAHNLLLAYLAEIDPSAQILDIGCGDGFYLEMLRNLGFTNILGIDPSNTQLAKARAKNLPVSLGQIEGLATPTHPLCRKQYDVVLLWDLIEHLEDPTTALQTVHRLLKPGGCCFINTVVCDSIHARLSRLLKKQNRLRQTQAIDASHIQPFTKKAIINLLTGQGFEILCAKRCGNRWPYFSKHNWHWLSSWTLFGTCGDILTIACQKPTP